MYEESNFRRRKRVRGYPSVHFTIRHGVPFLLFPYDEDDDDDGSTETHASRTVATGR
jgi:hypothetical protein